MGVQISFLQAAFMVFLTLFCSAKCALEVKLFNVEDYGAVASDTIDNSKVIYYSRISSIISYRFSMH